MFEKEAEDWIKNNLHNTEEDYIKAFKDGAEFGFRKGIKAKINTTTISDCPIKKQWHKVADVDLPTEEKKYLLKFNDGTIDVLYVGIDGNLNPFILTRECFNFYKDVEKWCEIPEED